MSRQKACTPVDRDFFKLMNKSNFRIDCRNNINNCILEPLYDDINEILYFCILKNLLVYSTLTLLDIFFPLQHLREEITYTFNRKILLLDKNEPTMRLENSTLRKKWKRNLMRLIRLKN